MAARFSLSEARVGPSQIYPDADMTPGAYDTLGVDDLTARWTGNCPAHKKACTYSQSHRDVSTGLHKTICDEYNVASDERNIQHGEVDHLYPLCAGGSNEKENLWYQPAENPWKGKNFGYHEKDQLEAWVCAQIKAKQLDPKEAYARFTHDWVKFYLDEHLDGASDGPDADTD
jgi:hypothetical protein